MRKLSISVNSYKLLTLCFILSIVFYSCTQEEEAIVVKDENASEELIQYLEASGFDRNTIVLKDGVFIIAEDILISKEEVQKYVDLSKSTSQGRIEHYRGSYLVSDAYVTNIKFYINSSVPASWANAVRGAVAQWNSVNGTKLYMSVVTNSAEANTTITTGYSTSNWVARAYLPTSSRKPGNNLEINTKYNTLSDSYKLFTIVHEMGHIFGLYHTDQTEGIFIPGTPTKDANSVMNSYVLPWNGFTNGDVKAVQVIYPG